MEEKVFDELKKFLVENIDAPYDAEDDMSMPKLTDKRKPVLTLRKLNRLKDMRNAKREELAQDSVLAPYLYGPPENPEGEAGMGGDLGLGI